MLTSKHRLVSVRVNTQRSESRFFAYTYVSWTRVHTICGLVAAWEGAIETEKARYGLLIAHVGATERR